MLHDPVAGLHLEVRGVSKLFGTTAALWRVDLEAHAGEFVLAAGANGSGKSTLLRVVTGLTPPTVGDVIWTGGLVPGQPRIAYVGHASGLYDGLTPLEHLQLAARLARTDLTEALTVLDRFGVARVVAEPCRRLSAGMRRRVALARVFASRADVIVLDEPLAALDESGVTTVLELVVEASSRGGLVLAAAPSDARLRPAAHRVLALADGRVLRAVEERGTRLEQVDAG